MKISIVIPSWNQAEFLEETLASVRSQSYPHREIVVVDGGSTDGSLAILQKHERDLAWWCHEPDEGQTDAINKGLRHISGDVWMYLNSDDLLLPGALATVAKAFEDPATQWVGGSADIMEGETICGEIVPSKPERPSDLLRFWARGERYFIPFSGASYLRTSLLERLGPLDATYDYSMDTELGVRACLRESVWPRLLPEKLALWRWHGRSKSMRQGLAWAFRADEIRIVESYLRFLPEEQQALVRRELVRERHNLTARKACFELSQQRRGRALVTLAEGAMARPGHLSWRPWWGALRRVLTPSQTVS